MSGGKRSAPLTGLPLCARCQDAPASGLLTVEDPPGHVTAVGLCRPCFDKWQEEQDTE